MNSVTGGEVPEFAIPAREYRLDAMRELVDHPSINAEGVEPTITGEILRAYVNLGHVAIAQGDNEAYDAWMTHTSEFANTAQLRETHLVTEQHFAEVTRLRFYGAIHGRMDMADEVHNTLDAATTRYNMDGLIELCAEHKINPGVWIERHVKNADERAAAWGDYLVRKQITAERTGRELKPEELREPGSERFLKDVIDGELSHNGVISWGTTAYSLADTPHAKKQVIDRYSLAISGLEEQDDFGYVDSAILRFATNVLSDPDVAHDVKMDLYNQVDAEVTNWDDKGQIQPRGALEIAKAIANGEDVQATLDRLDDITKKRITNAASQRNFQQYFARSAGELYAAHGDYEQAASQLSRLNSLLDWQRGVELFVRKGGDMQLMREADSMRRSFDAAIEGEESDVYKGCKWADRVIMTDLIENIVQRPDTAKARTALLALAEKTRTSSHTTLYLLEDFTKRLLTTDPTAVSIGPELAEKVGDSTDKLVLYQLFAKHGSKEMEAAGWEYVNRMQVPDRSMYLIRYASMAATSSMVKGE